MNLKSISVHGLMRMHCNECNIDVVFKRIWLMHVYPTVVACLTVATDVPLTEQKHIALPHFIR